MATTDQGTDYRQWLVELTAAEKVLVPGMLLRLRKQLAFLTLGAAVELTPGSFRKISGVVLLTPVYTGRAQSSWNVSARIPDLSVPAAGQSSYSAASPADAAQALSTLGHFDIVWVTSNLPYIKVLEFGLYPDPPAGGAGKTVGGYSRQAPAGMLRITVRNVLQALRGA